MEGRGKTTVLWVVIAALMIVAALGLAAGPAGAQTDYAVWVVTDVPYIEDGLAKHTLDVYYPENVAHPTVLFFVHGGAWKSGNKSEYSEVGMTMSGFYPYTTVVINYELSNPEDGSAVHPDHVRDVASAFAWVRRNIAAYGGDPGDIHVFGHSAGGHLISLLSTDGRYLAQVGCSKADVRSAICMSGITDLHAFVKYPGNPYGLSYQETLMYKGTFFLAFGGWSRSVLYPASPSTYVGSTQPQFCGIYADYDMPGMRLDAIAFYNRVRGFAGQSPALVRIPRSDVSEETWAQAVAMAGEAGFSEDKAGHWADIMSINTNEPYSRSVTTVANWVNTH
ncbi:MAG: alpha/beta hydrolase [Actinobacteria bacterium]|nr:alpha/beta hydrolase [Actinomycetota bacterium]MBU1943976.1 alpha/beta hydrolase [Actinomycetota bacterium]MBU2686936.1 alpha/beta hydrolase [Actinomycetota bacterium]